MGKEADELKKTKEALSRTRKELDRYVTEAGKLSINYSALTNDFNEMAQKFTNSQRLRVIAETEVSGLRKEIEDLSSALFSQANDMVSTARKSEHDYKQKNKHLQNEIEEKDLLISTYEQQLAQLKDMLGRKNVEDNSDVEEKNEVELKSANDVLSSLLYSPPVQVLRYDLELFESFVTFANHQNSTKNGTEEEEGVHYKDTKFYKRILHDDVQPTLRLDTAPGVSFLQKRSLMSAIINGRAIIEPISSVNESYKRQSGVLGSVSRPIATPDSCSICGESRNNTLQHARLYMLKIYSSKTGKKPHAASSDSIENSESNEYTYTFPLCAYCVFRIRSSCELYAFLRSLQQGVWKLDNEVNQKKAWIECTRIRLKMFWSRLGIWDMDDRIVDNKSFNGEQILGGVSAIGAETSFEFEEKPVVEKRASYMGSLVERWRGEEEKEEKTNEKKEEKEEDFKEEEEEGEKDREEKEEGEKDVEEDEEEEKDVEEKNEEEVEELKEDSKEIEPEEEKPEENPKEDGKPKETS